MFSYCGNNPIQFSDAEGTFFFTALGAITGFVGSALTTAAVNIFSLPFIIAKRFRVRTHLNATVRWTVAHTRWMGMLP